MSDRQMMPDIAADVLAAMRESISRFGVIVPIVVDQHGQIIDGHNRWAIASDLNVDCPSVVVQVDNDADALAIASTLNLDRRHMDPTARATLARTLRNSGHSLRAIGGALGVDHTTVRADLELLDDPTVPSGEPDTVLGLDGKERPAKRRSPWTAEELADLLNRWNAATCSQSEFAETEGLTPANLAHLLTRARKGEGEPAAPSRPEQVRELAVRNYTSAQIATELGVGEPAVKDLAKRHNIDIPADRVVGRVRRLDSVRFVSQLVMDVDAAVAGLDLVDLAQLDPEQCAEWATSLSDPLRALTRFHKQLKEMAL